MPKVKAQTNWRSNSGQSKNGNEAPAVDNDGKMGFQNREKAEQTLKILIGRDITHQFRVISSLTNRAKTLLKKTKDPFKIQNISEAIQIFDDWLGEYKTKNRGKENFGYLPLAMLNSYKELADHMGVLDNSTVSGNLFHDAYQEAEGDVKKLRSMSPVSDGETWDVVRNAAIRRLTADKMPTGDAELFHADGPLQGLPTPLHVKLIMWAYSPDPPKVKKEAANVHWKVQKNMEK